MHSDSNARLISERRRLSRRTLLGRIGAGLSAYALSTGPLAGASDPTRELPSGIGTLPDFLGPLPQRHLGRKRPLSAEEKTARDIIAATPKGPRPYDVAGFFLSIASGETRPEWKPYMGGWPDRWNPLIVEFFGATETQPDGDETAWCAAFVNWCYLQAGWDAPTHSASSGSFRCCGTATDKPNPGDIVVFRDVGSEDACHGRGHVGFFVKERGDFIEVLGGNQIDRHDGSHAISSKALPRKGKVLVLHSYRTKPPQQEVKSN